MPSIRNLNIDWLQLFGDIYDTANITENLQKKGFQVTLNEKSTKHFGKWYTVFTKEDKLPFAQICCEPFSLREAGGIFNRTAATVQLTNRFCYHPDPIALMREFCDIIDFTAKCFSRIDLALDFRRFDNGMKPLKFVRNVLKGEYWRKGHKKIRAIGDLGAEFMTESFGDYSKTAMPVSMKIYNKTLEMGKNDSKPWIYDSWRASGLTNEVGDVWRLEISIRPEGKDLVNIDTGEYVKVGIKDLETHEQRLKLFWIFAEKVFHFRYKEFTSTGMLKKKSECRRVPLFQPDELDIAWKPTRVTMCHDATRGLKIKLNQYLKEYENMENPEPVRKAYFTIIVDMMKKYKLCPGSDMPEIKRIEEIVKMLISNEILSSVDPEIKKERFAEVEERRHQATKTPKEKIKENIERTATEMQVCNFINFHQIGTATKEFLITNPEYRRHIKKVLWEHSSKSIKKVECTGEIIRVTLQKNMPIEDTYWVDGEVGIHGYVDRTFNKHKPYE